MGETMENERMEEEKEKVLRYRWIIYILLVLVYFLSNFHKFATGVMKDELMEAFQLSTTQFGNLGSMVFYSYLIMQIPTGVLVDTVGARKTVSVGCLITALGSMMFALAQTGVFANISRLLIGFGISVAYISLLKVQTKWFCAKEFATITGITFLIGNLGSILAQTPFRLLVDAFSWRSTYMLFALISIVMSLLVYLFVKNSPEDMGLVSIELIEGKSSIPAQEAPKKEKDDIREILKEVVTNHYNWPLFLMMVSVSATLTTLSGSFGSVYIRDTYGLTMVDASKYTMILTLGIAVGAAIIGALSDFMKRRKIIMVVLLSVLNAIWVYIVFICHGTPNITCSGILYFLTGLSLTAYTLPYTVAKESNNPRYAGMSISFVGLFSFIGSAFGPVIVGKVIDNNSALLTGGALYAKAFTIVVACNTIALIGALLVKETRCKNIFSHK